MTQPPYYEVDVPIRNRQPRRSRTGRARRLRRGPHSSRSRASDPPPGSGRLVLLRIPARLKTRLVRRNGRPLEEPVHLAQLHDLEL